MRVDLGQVVPANQPMTLRFRWSGALLSPEGGPLATKRLAYVGPEGSYLMYASRWFPFHDYAADRATSDITLIVPTGLQVAGTSDDPVDAAGIAKGWRHPLSFCSSSTGADRKLRRRAIHQSQSALWQLRNSVLREAGQRRPHQQLCRDDGPACWSFTQSSMARRSSARAWSWRRLTMRVWTLIPGRELFSWRRSCLTRRGRCRKKNCARSGLSMVGPDGRLEVV